MTVRFEGFLEGRGKKIFVVFFCRGGVGQDELL